MSNGSAGNLELYKAYLGDLGRIGERHQEARKFYISVISALFVFLSMAGNGVLVNVKGWTLVIVGVVGILICLAWYDHMVSFGTLYRAKLETLRTMENDPNLTKPFVTETEILTKPKDPNYQKPKWRYRPLTLLDRVAPASCMLLFLGLVIFKFRD